MSEERKLKDDEKGRLCTLKYYKKLKHRNETMKNINYAIFDMDGTLLDSMHIWDTASGAFLMMRGIRPFSQAGVQNRNKLHDQGIQPQHEL